MSRSNGVRTKNSATGEEEGVPGRHNVIYFQINKLLLSQKKHLRAADKIVNLVQNKV
jgi:hypothetical protein